MIGANIISLSAENAIIINTNIGQKITNTTPVKKLKLIANEDTINRRIPVIR